MEQDLTCQQGDRASLWMSLALDGELSAAQEEQLQAHLAGCPRCQAEWEAMQAASALLAAEPLVSPAWGFSARVDQRISQEMVRPRRVLSGLAVVTGSLTAVAAVVALLVGVLALLWSRVGTPPPVETAVDSGSQVASGIGLLAKSASLLLMDLLTRYGLPVAAIAALIVGATVAVWVCLATRGPRAANNGWAS
jgi:anti-sigma factor RsiW